jgi:endonuclease YncB( thermonuclease family)
MSRTKRMASMAHLQVEQASAYGNSRTPNSGRKPYKIDGTNVNHTPVQDGWWYRKYALGNSVLERLEREAREAKIGLWANPAPVPPWQWRETSGSDR